MKKRKFLLSLILIFILSLSLVSLSSVVFAVAPSSTYTPDRDGNLTETQDAYNPINSLKLNLSGAQDLVFFEVLNRSYLFIADTGNGRGLIINANDYSQVAEFGKEEALVHPTGIFVIKGRETNTLYIYITDYDNKATSTSLINGRIIRYSFDTLTEKVTLKNIYGTPSSWILETDDYVYKPLKIAVSDNYYMYVTADGATSGILMINENNEFITYFAANTIHFSIMEKIQYFFYGDNEKANLEKKLATAPLNVMIDGTGYVYTITKGSSSKTDDDSSKNKYTDYFKKVNTGGVNYFPTDMIAATDFVDAYYGKYSNTYAITSSGFIYEYDNEGNLLFNFGGKGEDIYGLFSSASSIAVGSNDYLYILDDTRNNLQVFKPTKYCELVHEALLLYTEAKYEEAKDLFTEVLRYNSMFDLAHKGVGLAYYMEGNYKEALSEFYISNDKIDYSDAFWEIRNLYLISNLSTIILLILIFIASLIILGVFDRKYHFMHYAAYPFKKLGQVKFVNQVFYSFTFLRHPENAVYEIKKNRRSTIISSSVLLLILFAEYLLGLVYTGFIFNDVVIEKTILLKEGVKIILPIILFIIANYLMSSLMDGEGRFRDIWTSTVGALTPIIIIYPWIILISRALTNSEAFLYTFLLILMFIWAGLLLFMNIKNTHNYSVGQTIVNLLLTIFMMAILVLVILILYVMVYQIYSFIADIIKEVSINA